MELNFIGTGSAFNPQLGNTSAYFRIDHELYLIDCGESVFGKIWHLPELTRCHDIYIVLTHLHSDHVGSLGSLISYCHFALSKSVTVVFPDSKILLFLDLCGISRAFYRYVPVMPEANARFEAVPVEHVEDMRCFGYLISTKSWKIYYSGDARTIPPSVVKMLLDGQLDRIYQDTSLSDSSHGNNAHCSLSHLETIVPPKFRSTICCMHLEENSAGPILSKGFSIAKCQ